MDEPMNAVVGIDVSKKKFDIAFLDNEIKETKKRIRDHIDNHPDLKQKKTLLESIPGIGEATIGIILSEFSQIDTFTNGKALAAFIGVTPRERQSGSSVRGRTRMSKNRSLTITQSFLHARDGRLTLQPHPH